MKSDADYRREMIDGGVRLDLIATLSGHELDCVGNIVGIYRTSMKEQDPIAYEIEVKKLENRKRGWEDIFPTFAKVGDSAISQGGMSIRDWFAGQALIALMPAILGEYGTFEMEEEAKEHAVKLSWLYADAMLEARKR